MNQKKESRKDDIDRRKESHGRKHIKTNNHIQKEPNISLKQKEPNISLKQQENINKLNEIYKKKEDTPPIINVNTNN